MLEFTKIEINNFGPYKGENIVCLSNEHGVTIFWGDNGRGKTTLLNAFRYGLFGVVAGRHNKYIELSTMENKEGRSEGIYGFSVTIEMKHDNDNYKLIRSYTPISPNIIPLNDSDYEQNVYLYKNSNILSRDDLAHTLNTLMPREVSRFFLFDGELLKDYEDLVVDDDSSSDLIKESIEKILGVPVLQNAIRDLNSHKNQIDSNMGRVARNSQRTIELSNRLSIVNEELTNHKSTLESYNQKLNEYKEAKKELETTLEKYKKINELIVIDNTFTKDLVKLKDEKKSILLEIKEVTSLCWRGMISNRLDSIIEKLKTSIESLERKKIKGITANNFINEMKKACKDKICPICTQELGPNLLQYLQEKIQHNELEFSGLSSDEEEMLVEYTARTRTLESMVCSSKKEALVSLENRLSRITVDIDSKEESQRKNKIKIEKYREDNGEIPDFNIKLRDYADNSKKISNIQQAIDSEKEKIQEKEQERQAIFSQIQRFSEGNDELTMAIEKSRKIEKILEIFNKGVEKYCSQLKQNVERDATEIFLKLANDTGYEKLVINDRYGLEIYTSEGVKVPNRSSGYEHVVALSLIAALHKNAPLQGPIVMDSPFGRLDRTHSNNIIKVLPLMANQVILLAFDSEIDAQYAREILGKSLISEKKLQYVTSLHTMIE